MSVLSHVLPSLPLFLPFLCVSSLQSAFVGSYPTVVFLSISAFLFHICLLFVDVSVTIIVCILFALSPFCPSLPSFPFLPYSYEEAAVYDGDTNRVIGTRTCNYKRYPRSHACGHELLKRVDTKRGAEWRAHKTYYYRPVSVLLRRLYRREDFAALCNAHINRPNTEYLDDIWDGSEWRDDPFFKQQNNLGFLAHFDDFDPRGKSSRKHHSSGVLLLEIGNIPSYLRSQEQFQLVVGFVPGPHKPSENINPFIQPFVDDMQQLETAGIMCGQILVRAKVALWSCDLMALWCATQHLGHRSPCGCPWCLYRARIVCRQKLESGAVVDLANGEVKVGKGYSNTTNWEADLDELGE